MSSTGSARNTHHQDPSSHPYPSSSSSSVSSSPGISTASHAGTCTTSQSEVVVPASLIIDGTASDSALRNPSHASALLSSSFMKSTHIPLLRSSPAAGTGSYGALPSPDYGEGSSYTTSLLSTTLSEDVGDDDDNDEEEEEGERAREGEGGLEEHHDRTRDDDNGWLAPPRLRERRVKRVRNLGVPTLGDTGVPHKGGGEAERVDTFAGDAANAENQYEQETEEEEDEDEDDEDSADNSPWVLVTFLLTLREMLINAGTPKSALLSPRRTT